MSTVSSVPELAHLSCLSHLQRVVGVAGIDGSPRCTDSCEGISILELADPAD